MRVHEHDVHCPAGCTRQADIDGATLTGLHKLVRLHKEIKRSGRPPRKGDKSLAWWLGYHAAKAAVQLLLALALLAVAAWAKHCGVKLPEVLP